MKLLVSKINIVSCKFLRATEFLYNRNKLRLMKKNYKSQQPFRHSYPTTTTIQSNKNSGATLTKHIFIPENWKITNTKIISTNNDNVIN